VTSLEITPDQAMALYNGRMVTGDAILDEDESVAAVWGEGDDVLWAEGEGLMIASHQGLGKTTIAQQLGLGLMGIAAKNLLGFPVRETPGRVLYLAMDRPKQALRSWRRMVTDEDRARLSERLVIWKGPLPVDIMRKPDELTRFAQAICPGVSVIMADSVKDFAPGISKDEVAAALNISWQGVIASEIELLLLHHQRKASQGAARMNALDDVYGSTWLTSGLGSVLALDGMPGDDRVSMLHLKQPAAGQDEMILRHDHKLGTTERIVAASTVTEALLMLGTESTASDIAYQMYLRDVDEAMLKRVRRQLDKMLELEKVIKYPGSRGGAPGGQRGGQAPDTWGLVAPFSWMRKAVAQATSP
jgi:AAA domain